MVTKEQARIVNDTWKIITPISLKMGQEFYSRLFETNPELKPMFKSDPKDQAMKLMFMLSYLVHRLENIEELTSEIEKLARRHKGYGASEQHYEIIGNTLLWSLEQNLGDNWNEKTEQAWKSTYELISGLMIKAQAAD